ncbi:MAG: hypothetical protein ACXV8P_00200 [Methylobacter sp.]
MSTEFNPPLAIHFIWHPSDASIVEPILAEIKKSFARDKDRPFSRGLNIPLFFYSTQNPLEVPDHWPAEVANRNVVFVFASINTAGNTKWLVYVEGLTVNGAMKIVPVALDTYGLSHNGSLKSLNCIRAFNWPNENKNLYAIVFLAHELYRYGFVDTIAGDKGKNSSITLFLSHAKAGDTGRLHAESIKNFIDNTNMNRFFDSTEISPGFPFDEEIEKFIPDSTLLAIESDAYSSRYWCQKEILSAKRHNRPIVAVDCLEEYEDRIFPAASNIPCVHVPPEAPLGEKDILRILAAAILETIRHEYSIKSLNYYQSRGWIDSDCETSSRPIEIRQALSIKDLGKSKVCYPEPPVYQEEADWHEKIGIMAFTPLWKPNDRDKFNKLRIGISISDALSDGYTSHNLSSDHLIRLAQDIARHLLARAAVVIYGGDLRIDGFTQFILDEAMILKSRLMTDSIHVENHLAWPLYIDSYDGNFVRINQWRAEYKNIMATKEHLVPLDVSDNLDQNTFLRPDTTQNKYIWSRCLTEMREKSIASSTARICAGGRLEGYKGKMPGVLEEILIAFEQSKPIYLLGGFNGVVGEVCKSILNKIISEPLTEGWQVNNNSGYFDLQKLAKESGYHADYDRVRDILEEVQISDLANKAGLSEDEYMRLMKSPFIDECIHLILKGLENLN